MARRDKDPDGWPSFWMLLIGILGAPYSLYLTVRDWWRERKNGSDERVRPRP